jgi:hypothetical protein
MPAATFSPSDQHPRKEILCTICQEAWDNPVELRPCAHVFCKGCVGTSVTRCPNCRQAIQAQMEPNRILLNMANSVRVTCDLCGWNGTREQSRRHECPLATAASATTASPSSAAAQDKKKKKKGGLFGFFFGGGGGDDDEPPAAPAPAAPTHLQVPAATSGGGNDLLGDTVSSLDITSPLQAPGPVPSAATGSAHHHRQHEHQSHHHSTHEPPQHLQPTTTRSQDETWMQNMFAVFPRLDPTIILDVCRSVGDQSKAYDILAVMHGEAVPSPPMASSSSYPAAPSPAAPPAQNSRPPAHAATSSSRQYAASGLPQQTPAAAQQAPPSHSASLQASPNTLGAVQRQHRTGAGGSGPSSASHSRHGSGHQQFPPPSLFETVTRPSSSFNQPPQQPHQAQQQQPQRQPPTPSQHAANQQPATQASAPQPQQSQASRQPQAPSQQQQQPPQQTAHIPPAATNTSRTPQPQSTTTPPPEASPQQSSQHSKYHTNSRGALAAPFGPAGFRDIVSASASYDGAHLTEYERRLRENTDRTLHFGSQPADEAVAALPSIDRLLEKFTSVGYDEPLFVAPTPAAASARRSATVTTTGPAPDAAGVKPAPPQEQPAQRQDSESSDGWGAPITLGTGGGAAAAAGAAPRNGSFGGNGSTAHTTTTRGAHDDVSATWGGAAPPPSAAAPSARAPGTGNNFDDLLSRFADNNDSF